MKTMKNLSAFCIIAFISCGANLYAGQKSLLEYINERYETKVYVAELTNSSGDYKIDPAALRKKIEDAFAARMSHDFRIVKSRPEADIAVYLDIVGYVFTEEDPPDLIITPLTVMIDLAKKDHYARMQADVRIEEVKKNRNLWEGRIKATVTNADMTKDESYDLVNERLVKVFFTKLFKKNAR